MTTLHPSREYYSGGSGDPTAPLQSFFEGEATSEVGRTEGLTRDLWSAMQPDLSSFDPIIAKGDRLYAREVGPAIESSDPQVQAALADLQGQLVAGLSERYLNETPPAEIRFNVNPFVDLVLARRDDRRRRRALRLWPTAEGRRRRVSDVYGARLARELAHRSRIRERAWRS